MEDRRLTLKRLMPVGIAVAVAALLWWWVYDQALVRTDGVFAYGLDDAYIHLAIAKNLVLHGVWGVTQYEPTSASSSPLWVALLALCFLIAGVNDWLPLVLNAVFAVLSLFVLDSLMSQFGFGRKVRAATLAGLVVGLPFVALMLSGMEHFLHLFLMLLVFRALLPILRGEQTSRAQFVWLVGLGALATLCRYESAALFLIPSFQALTRRRAGLAAPLVGGAIGVLVFGLFSKLQGMPFLPSSIVVKSLYTASLTTDGGMWQALTDRVLMNLRYRSATWISLGALTLAMISALWGARWAKPLAASVLLGIVLQVALGGTTQIYRYEAYLFGVGVVALVAALALPKSEPQATETATPSSPTLLDIVSKASDKPHYPRAPVWGASVLAMATLIRGIAALIESPKAISNIHDQHIQMARFVGDEFPNGTVALNDIGAVAFYTEAKIVDLWGLANQEVATLKAAGKYDKAAIAGILKRTSPDVLIIYPEWFQPYGGLPYQDLALIATWQFRPENISTAGSNTVYIAALKEKAEAARFAAYRFDEKMPAHTNRVFR